MGYVDSNLMDGESVVYKAKLHWILYVPPTIWLTVGIVSILMIQGVKSVDLEDESSKAFLLGSFYVLAFISFLTAFSNNRGRTTVLPFVIMPE